MSSSKAKRLITILQWKIRSTYSNDDGPEESCGNTRSVHVDSTSRDLYRRNQNLLNIEMPFRRKLNYWRNKPRIIHYKRLEPLLLFSDSGEKGALIPRVTLPFWRWREQNDWHVQATCIQLDRALNNWIWMKMNVYVCSSVCRLDGNVWGGHFYIRLCFIKVGCFRNAVHFQAGRNCPDSL